MGAIVFVYTTTAILTGATAKILAEKTGLTKAFEKKDTIADIDDSEIEPIDPDLE